MPARILYVETRARFAQVVCREYLKDADVTVVATMAEAERVAVAGLDFDAILADYDLKDGNGTALVKSLRAKGVKAPIIAVSSHEFGNQSMLRAGANAICDKMNLEKVQSVLADLMK
ncbi:MAG: DNA-binding response OmpR family regulator [Bradymonadia bacterium]|jgi:DNA-binding response OmpR family regulator